MGDAGYRVLLLEPDRLLADVYMQALSAHGFLVDHVTSAEEAIVSADERCPDIVLMELQLAGHSGAAFLYEFRSYADWCHVPVVANTMLLPDALYDVRDSLRELGVAVCLYKPQANLRQLISVVRRQLVSTKNYIS